MTGDPQILQCGIEILIVTHNQWQWDSI